MTKNQKSYNHIVLLIKKEKTMKNQNEIFRFHNANPKGLKNANDCVIRAISFATNKSWDKVHTELFDIAMKKKNTATSRKVFVPYLNSMGYIKKNQPKNEYNKRIKLYEFCEKYKYGIYIISLRKHLTCVIDGIIYDTWNCCNHIVGNYWKVK